MKLLGIIGLSVSLICSLSCGSSGSDANSKQKQYVIMETSMGKIVMKLFTEDAPKTCEHFIKLINQGFYNNQVFFRVVKEHVIQAGCPKGDGSTDCGCTVKAEFNQNKHVVGTLGLARDTNPDSGSSQFYICLVPRPHLDGKYTVFGQVTEGLDVVDAIGAVEVNEKYIENIAFHVPKKPVVIKSASIVTK
ncbi:MAG: peptidylprolyl isomerase [Planctomycetes bacterium]|nr:peptidylprolyl isomerase [Planctomycetota bacterium]